MGRCSSDRQPGQSDPTCWANPFLEITPVSVRDATPTVSPTAAQDRLERMPHRYGGTVMSGTRSMTGQISRWLPALLRVVVVTITLYPALRKFLEYAYRVQAFRAYGVPWPELTVPLSGMIELLAIVSIGAGIAGRLGAGSLVVTMLVAIVAAGPNPFNGIVLVASAGITLLGTGPYSAWDPAPSDLLGLLASSVGDPGPPKRGHRE